MQRQVVRGAADKSAESPWFAPQADHQQIGLNFIDQLKQSLNLTAFYRCNVDAYARLLDDLSGLVMQLCVESLLFLLQDLGHVRSDG